MPITIGGSSGVTFNDATLQTTAFTVAAAWPGVYNGAVANNTAYPVGTVLFAQNGTGSAQILNTSVTVSVNNTNPGYAWFSSVPGGYSAVPGTWRNRGNLLDANSAQIGLLSRTA